MATMMVAQMNAQDFPSPYCDIEEYYEVEEITRVTFGGVEIINTDFVSPLVNKISSVANVTQGGNFTITAEGNAYGPFDNDYYIFIDWNQNGVFENTEDYSEAHYINYITGSDGNDGEIADGEIEVPADALVGSTRARLFKVYTDYSDGYELYADPCGIYVYDAIEDYIDTNYGQALDFTVNVTSLGVVSNKVTAINVSPNPVKDMLTITAAAQNSTSLKAVEIHNLLGQKVFSQSLTATQSVIDMSGLQAGTYLVNIFTTNGAEILKVVKQ